MDGNLPGLGGKYLSFDAQDIAHVIFLEIFIAVLTHAVPCHIYLDIPLQILDIAKRCFSHHTFEHHPAGNADRLAFQCAVIVFYLLAVFRYLILRNLKWVFAVALQVFQFLMTDF